MKQPPNDTVMWFAVYIRSRSEKAMRKVLERQCIEHFLPTVNQWKLHGNRRRNVEFPLIPGYIFVAISRRDYAQVLQIPHVVDFVRFGKELIPIPQREIDIIRQVCNNLDNELLVNPLTYQPGDLVEVTTGPLEGISGKLTAVQGRKNLVIELKNVGRSLQVVHIETKYLRRLNTAKA